MDLTNTQLKLNYWLISHKQHFKKGLIFLLIILNLFLWGFSGYKWVYYIKETPQFRQAMKEMKKDFINWPAIHLKNKVQPLEISNLSFISLGESRYDLIVQLNNPNANWLVPYLDYKFFWADREVKQSTFLLALEKKFLLALNIKSDIAPKDLNLEFLKINWQRITPKQKILDFQSSDFVISNISSNTSLKRVSFQAKNSSACSFWTVYFEVILYQGGKVVAVNKIPVNKFLSGQEKLVEVPFPQGLPYFSQILIEPEINILDPDNFIPLKDKASETK